MPCIENLLRAFAAQDEAQRTTTSGEFERGVSSTLTELHMAINDNMSQPDGGFPDINMSSRADRLDCLFQYFFDHYLRECAGSWRRA